uniref:Uncharacterized protein n=1 Tax=Meloidogyne incognita TaxID=6306 RepID=A0A914M5T9_MELIC
MATPEKFFESAKKLGYKSRIVDLNKVKKWEGKECENIENNDELLKQISYLQTYLPA